MSTFLSYLKNISYDLIAPPYCVSCKKFLSARDPLCSECLRSIQPVVSILLPITSTKSIKVLAISDYQNPLKRLIWAKRYGKRVASSQLGELIWQMTYVQKTAFDVIVPIPLHWTRYAWRGYNQAEEIGNILGAASGKPVENLLWRTQRTAFQSTLRKKERAQNIQHIFALTKFEKEKYRDKHILLVDDLLTTGATMREAARVLQTLRPASITGVVACRVV